VLIRRSPRRGGYLSCLGSLGGAPDICAGTCGSSQTILSKNFGDRRERQALARQLNILQTVVSSFHHSAGPDGPGSSSVKAGG
jgi:hypothetical protein